MYFLLDKLIFFLCIVKDLVGFVALFGIPAVVATLVGRRCFSGEYVAYFAWAIYISTFIILLLLVAPRFSLIVQSLEQRWQTFYERGKTYGFKRSRSS